MTNNENPKSEDQKEKYSSDGLKAVKKSAHESEEIEPAFQKIAEKKPEHLMEVMMAMGMSTSANPLHNKMTPEHISQVIDFVSKHDERQYDLHKRSQEIEFSDGKSDRAYCFTAFFIIVLLTGLVVYLFRDKPEVLVPILTGLGGLVSGFIGGWGFGRKQK